MYRQWLEKEISVFGANFEVTLIFFISSPAPQVDRGVASLEMKQKQWRKKRRQYQRL